MLSVNQPSVNDQETPATNALESLSSKCERRYISMTMEDKRETMGC